MSLKWIFLGFPARFGAGNPRKIHFKLNPNQGYGYISIRVSVRVRVRVADLGEILVELGFIIPPVRVV